MGSSEAHIMVLEEMQQHLYDILRSGAYLLSYGMSNPPSEDASIFAIECLAQLQKDFDDIMLKHGIQPLEGVRLEEGLEPGQKLP